MRIEALADFEKKILRGSIEDFLNKVEIEDIEHSYYTKEIPKKNNDKRVLNCIKQGHPLYIFQKKLKNNFLDYIPLSNAAYGYIKQRSYTDYLSQHTEKKFFLKLDIKDFFTSIKESKLRNTLKYYFSDITLKNKTKNIMLLDLIMKFVTLNGSLPQGAITSPVLSNIFFRSLDIRINRYCKKLNITYSRYVDDLLFSSNDLFIHKKVFVNGISKILSSGGFKLNYSKLIKAKDEISLNGFVVGKNIRLSRNKLSYLSSIIYCYQNSQKKDLTHLKKEIVKHFPQTTNEKIDFVWLHHYLAGYRSFLLSVLPFDSSGILPEELSKEHSKILSKINCIENILLITVKAQI